MLWRATGRTYQFTRVAPSVTGALSIAATGELSTVGAGWDGGAGRATMTVTVRAIDDQGMASDLAIAAAKAAGKPSRTVLSRDL